MRKVLTSCGQLDHAGEIDRKVEELGKYKDVLSERSKECPAMSLPCIRLKVSLVCLKVS
ncbi:hypothetical protein D3C80_1840170 [compost metagenome]